MKVKSEEQLKADARTKAQYLASLHPPTSPGRKSNVVKISMRSLGWPQDLTGMFHRYSECGTMDGCSKASNY